jgi:hypothetical protein
MLPNKALELTGRRFSACQALQPAAARFGVDSAGARRTSRGTFTGGRQLNAVSVRRLRASVKTSILRLIPIGIVAHLGCSVFLTDPARRCYVDQTGPLCTVSFIELVTRPEIYAGRRVRVSGWLHLEFEGDALYLHREDYERSLIPNSFRISAPDSLRLRASEFSDQYCIVGGTFVAYTAEEGTMRFESGGLKDLTLVLRLPESRGEIGEAPLAAWYSTP